MQHLHRSLTYSVAGFLLAFAAATPTLAQLPADIHRITSAACKTAEAPTTVEAALATGCYRPWPPHPGPKATDAEKAALARQAQHWRTIWQSAQIAGRGHYAVRPATPEELAELKKLASTSQSSGNALASWTGMGSKDTERFTVTSGEWRIAWSARSDSPVGGLLNIDVHSADGKRVSSINSGDIKGERNDTSVVRAPAGQYYLSIISANVQWRVSVER